MADTMTGWRAARERSAIHDLASGFVVLTGAERGAYLHSLVTNKVEDLAPGAGRRAFFLTPTKGRVLADVLACETGDALWLECAGASSEAVARLLGKYYFGQDVAFEDLSGAWRSISLQGPESAAALERAGLAAPLGEPGAHLPGEVAGVEVRVVRWSDTGESGFRLWVPARARSAVRATLAEAGAEPCGEEAWTVLQIEAGIAAYGRELGEETIPLEAPALDAMSFDKGCYPGQEIIARLHVRGRPARVLRGLRLDAPAAAGDVFDAPDKPAAARVTAAGVSPALGPVALAFVHRDFAESGTRLAAAGGGGSGAEVAELPMITVHA